MFRTIGGAILFGLVASSAQAQASYHVNPNATAVACTDRALMFGLAAAAQWHDMAALNRLEAPARAHCIILSPNENVTVIASEGSFYKIRRETDPIEYWTSKIPIGWLLGEVFRN